MWKVSKSCYNHRRGLPGGIWYKLCGIVEWSDIWLSRETRSREAIMRIKKGLMISLGYGKYFRSDSIIGLEPIEERRGPGSRTKVYIQGLDTPITVARSEQAILRDLVETPPEPTLARERHHLLNDLLDLMESLEKFRALSEVEDEEGHGWNDGSNDNP
jgi:hypothetical protein